MQEAEPVAVHAQIAPVGVENIPRSLRHLQRIQNFIDAVAARLYKVGEMGFHVGGIRISVNGVRIGLSVPNLVAQFKEVRHGLPGTRDILLHLVDKGFHAKGHFTIILLVRGNQMIGFGNADPIHLILHTQIPEQGPDVARSFRRAEVIQFMQAGFKLKPSPFEAGGKSAG